MGIELTNIERHINPDKAKKQIRQTRPFINLINPGGRKKLKDAKKEEFYSEIYLLIQSGLDLKQSIEIFSNQQQNTVVKEIFSGIEKKLIKGDSFSEALSQYPDFSPYEFYSIRIGEESGQLSDVLDELGRFYQRKIKQQKQLVSAFSYPAVILLTAIVAVGFMMNFIVPLFADAFKRFNADLPGLTLFIVNLSEGFRHYWWLAILLLGVFCIVILIFRCNCATCFGDIVPQKKG